MAFLNDLKIRQLPTITLFFTKPYNLNPINIGSVIKRLRKKLKYSNCSFKVTINTRYNPIVTFWSWEWCSEPIDRNDWPIQGNRCHSKLYWSLPCSSAFCSCGNQVIRSRGTFLLKVELFEDHISNWPIQNYPDCIKQKFYHILWIPAFHYQKVKTLQYHLGSNNNLWKPPGSIQPRFLIIKKITI